MDAGIHGALVGSLVGGVFAGLTAAGAVALAGRKESKRELRSVAGELYAAVLNVEHEMDRMYGFLHPAPRKFKPGEYREYQRDVIPWLYTIRSTLARVMALDFGFEDLAKRLVDSLDALHQALPDDETSVEIVRQAQPLRVALGAAAVSFHDTLRRAK